MTSGEKRFAVRLEQKLDDDYLVWYIVPIGKKQLHPDLLAYLVLPLRQNIYAIAFEKIAIADEARLLYAAMTRATEYLELSCDRDSVFEKRVEKII